MFLDTRSLDLRYVRVPDHLLVVLCDTNAPRSLSNSAYNERRDQCETAASTLGLHSLRDADMGMIEAANADLGDVVYRRARHVISENARCLAFVEALSADDRDRVGRLMRSSHESLRDDYEVTGPELDAMAEACWSSAGCVGARMTGGGFGGACVALVEREHVQTFQSEVAERYVKSSGKAGRIMVCGIGDGARLLIH